MAYGFYIGPTIVYAQKQTMLTVIELDFVNIKQDLVNKYINYTMLDNITRDENGRDHGNFGEYYQNGNLFYRANFVHGVLFGCFEVNWLTLPRDYAYYAR